MWRSVLLVEETGVSRENRQPAAITDKTQFGKSHLLITEKVRFYSFLHTKIHSSMSSD